jgi:hydroxyacylglutathione hydrolase
MKIHQIFFKNNLRNFCYLVSFDDGAIFCIDPYHAKEITDYLSYKHLGKHLNCIINTHDHCDHYSGNEELYQAYKCTIMAHPEALVPFKNKSLLDHEIIYQTQQADATWTLRAIYTPGHTHSHLCVLVEKNNIAFALFTGDCFFNAGVGNCHNGGDPEMLYQTIETIFTKLPDDLLIYPGHEYLKRNLEFTNHFEPHNRFAQNFLHEISSLNLDEHYFVNTMKIEREINTFLRLDSLDLRKKLQLSDSEKKKVFLTLRELRNKW